MSYVVNKPKGSVVLPALMCGLAAVALAVGLDVMGYFASVDAGLMAAFAEAPFYLQEPLVLAQGWSYFAAALGGWLVAVAVMDCVGSWRRWLVGGMSVMVAFGFCPVLMLWGIFWSPVVLCAAVLWGWFCAMVYTSQHLMPCEISEGVSVDSVISEEIISDVKVETIPFPVPFKSSEKKDDDGSERWQPKTGNGKD